MKKWTYNKAIEAYPTEPGDVWDIGDRFTITCGDLTTGLPPIDFSADLTYCDPPWHDSAQAMFYKQSGTGKTGPVRDTPDAMLRMCKATGALVHYVEYSRKDGELLNLMAAHGAHVLNTWDTTYARGQYRNRVIRYTWHPGVQPLGPNWKLEASDGGPMFAIGAEHAAGHFPQGGRVADFVTGLGATPFAAMVAGHSFVGNEMQPARVAETLHRIWKVTKVAPRRR